MLLFDQICRPNKKALGASLLWCTMVFVGLFWSDAFATTDSGITTLIITNPFECSMNVNSWSTLYYNGNYYTKYTTIFFSLYSDQANNYTITGDVVGSPLTGSINAMQTIDTQAELTTPDGVKHIMTLFNEDQAMCVSDTLEVYLDTSWPTPPDPVIPLVINDSNGNPDLIHFIWLTSVDTGVGFDSYTFVLADNEAFLNAYQVTSTENFWQVPVSAFSHTWRWFWQVFAYDYLDNMTPGVMGVFHFDLTSGSWGTDQNTGDNTEWWGPWSGTGTTTGNTNIGWWPGWGWPSVTTLIPGYLYCSGNNLYASNTPYGGWQPVPTNTNVLTNIHTNDIQDSQLEGDFGLTPTPSPDEPPVGQVGTMLPAPQSLWTPISTVHPVIPSTPNPAVSPVCIQTNGKWSCQPTTESLAVWTFIPFSTLRKLPPFGKKVVLLEEEDFIVQSHGSAPIKMLKVPANILPIILKKLKVPAWIQIYVLMMNTQFLTYSNYDLETLRRWYRMWRNRKQDPSRDIVWLDNEWFILHHTVNPVRKA